jgi:uncharacterized membrane protein
MTEHTTRHYAPRGSDLSRIISISDGLFATVLTLLVLEVKLPETAMNADAVGAMVLLWPRLFSYLLTFLVAGTYWVAHHYDFQHIRRFDGRLQWLNLMFLLCIGLLPASTAWVGQTEGTRVLAWTVYALNMALAGVMLAAVWAYAVARRAVDPALHPRLVRYVGLRHVVAPAVFLISIGVAIVAPPPFPAITPLLISPLHRLLGRLYLDPTKPSDADAEEATSAPGFHDLLWRLVSLLPVIGFIGWSLWLWLIAAAD